jgi:hypothetical protein
MSALADERDRKAVTETGPQAIMQRFTCPGSERG